MSASLLNMLPQMSVYEKPKKRATFADISFSEDENKAGKRSSMETTVEETQEPSHLCFTFCCFR